MVNYSPEELIAFENEIAELFNGSYIKAPVHLYAGNEKQIIDVFSNHNIKQNDWVFCSWRSHYQCLLKGVPQQALRQAILDGRSISLCFKEQRVFSSAIVTGQVPIAVGTALAIKRSGKNERVFCFMGDMTAETGIVHESIKYSRNNTLPVHFIIEDNGKSVCTDTRKTWGLEKLSFEDYNYLHNSDDYVTYYKYSLEKYPHAGAGKRVQF